MKHLLAHIFFIICLTAGNGYAQEINFGQFATEGITITNVGTFNALDFGQIISGEGTVQIQLTDTEVVVFEIEAEFDKDVFVTLTPPTNDELTEPNSGATMPFTLRAAYSNRGKNNVNQAEIISGTTARFPVLAREVRPPGPPPRPKDGEYTTPTAKAYLYLYGDIFVAQGQTAGTYRGTINIHVSYE